MTTDIVYKSPVLRIADELANRRRTIAVGSGAVEFAVGMCKTLIIHFIRQPTTGTATFKFQGTDQRSIDQTVFDTVENGTITFTTTPQNKKIIRDVYSSHVQVTQDSIDSPLEFVFEIVTYSSRS